MDPPQSVYDKNIYYRGFDITSHVKAGNNVVGAMLGNYKVRARGFDHCTYN